MHNGSSVIGASSPYSHSSSRSAGSSTRSWSACFLIGESGDVPKEELELGYLVWPCEENVGVTGDVLLEAADESREWAYGWE